MDQLTNPIRSRPDSLRAARAEATRAAVRAAALKLFDAHGYDGTGIRAIAHEAGVSTGAVFSNWPDKAALARDVLGLTPIQAQMRGATFRDFATAKGFAVEQTGEMWAVRTPDGHVLGGLMSQEAAWIWIASDLVHEELDR